MRQGLLPLLVMVIGCVQAPVEAPLKPPSAVNGAKGRVARESGRGERPWAAEDRRIPPGKERFSGELFAELPFSPRSGASPQRLTPNTLAFLHFEPGEYVGVRVLASRERVQRIEEPNNLVRLCVAWK
jgi:hypothetical protein